MGRIRLGRRRCLVATVGAWVMVGCQSGPAPDYPDFTIAPDAPAAGANAFDDYVKAAEQAEVSAKAYLTRTNFTPAYRRGALRALAGPIDRVLAAGGKPCQFRYEASEPFAAKSWRGGWRLIGRGLAWRVEDAIQNGNLDAAVHATLAGTRFGFDLAGGDCADATLGFTIADEVRQAMLPAVGRLDARQAGRLSSGLQRALQRLPYLAQTFEHERMQMRQAVQAIQTAYRQRDFGVFKSKLRTDIQPAIKYLQEIPPESQKRASYFESLAKEADETVAAWQELSRLNARQRADREPPTFEKTRPWRRWARHFFSAPGAVIPIRDRTVARTRMMALHAALHQRLRAGQTLPADLAAFSAVLRIDPYTGLSFVYRPTVGTYRLYSLGEDLRDDGGESNESGTTPDLIVESNAL